MIENVLIAFSVVTAVGLVSGVLLALASHFLHVPENEKVQKLRECLPGVNCGACGYTGCDEYAKALDEGNVKTNLCIPGADKVAADIAGVLGVEAEDVVEMVAYVHCNGNCEATGSKAKYSGVDTCRGSSMLFGGPADCRFGCLGCGDCAAECPVDAICIEDGIAHVNPIICIGCGMCVATCPKGIISLVPDVSKVAVMCSSQDKGAVARKNCKNACIGCKKCELNCPEKAITVENHLAIIDYSKCTACGKCAEVCPTKCIKLVELGA